MTVQELIEKLRTYPKYYDVIVWIEDEVLPNFEHNIMGIYGEREDSDTVDLMIE